MGELSFTYHKEMNSGFKEREREREREGLSRKGDKVWLRAKRHEDRKHGKR